MALWSYYESLLNSLYSKKDFIQRIMAEFDVSFTTARNWTKGHRVSPVNVIMGHFHFSIPESGH